MQSLFNLAFLSITLFFGCNIFYRNLPPELSANEKKHLFGIFLLGITFNLFVLFCLYLILGPYYLDAHSTQDSSVYDFLAQTYANYMRDHINHPSDLISFIASTKLDYSFFLGIVYAICGHSFLSGSIFNGLCSIFLSAAVYFIAYSMFNHKIARLALILNLFYPHYISASYALLKDIFLLSLVILFYLIIQTAIRKLKLSFFLLAFSLFSLFLIRNLRPAMTLVVLVIGGLHVGLSRIFRLSGKARIISLIFFGFCCLLIFGLRTSADAPSIRTQIERFHPVDSYVPYFERSISISKDAGPKEIINGVLMNPISFSILFIKNTVYTLWGPPYFYMRGKPGPRIFWIEEEGKFVLMENFSVLLRFFLMPMVFLGLIHCIKNNSRKQFLVYGFFISWLIIVAFIGADSRWALPLMPFLLILAAVGLKSGKFIAFRPIYILYILFLNIVVATNISYYDSLIIAIPLFLFTIIGIIFGIYHKNRNFGGVG